jgi:outer membrane protein assembly factor BamB
MRRLILVALTVAASPAFPQDWPQWRGPRRDGSLPTFTPPASWPASLKPTWKVRVGVGHASPVVVGDRVYVFAREGEEEVIQALDLATGRSLWRVTHPAPYTMNPAAFSHGKGPKSTPVVRDGRVCTLGIGGVLACHETATGRLLWRKDFAAEFKTTAPLYGTAMSPAIEGGMLIAHVGGHDSGALTAFDPATGAVKWSWKADGPGYASPVVMEIAGVRQVVTQTQSHVVGLSLDKGTLLWKIPFTTDYDQNAITPVVRGDVLIYSGINQPVRAVRLVKRGDTWTTEPVWENPEVATYMSTPVLHGDHLYGFSHRKKGQFFCLDVKTGKTLWLGDGRQGENAAILAAPGLLFFLTNDARLRVARNDPRAFTALATYSVADSPTWAHPAIAAGRILVKDAETLVAWSLE